MTGFGGTAIPESVWLVGGAGSIVGAHVAGRLARAQIADARNPH
jgi:hypothetical protein